MRTSNVCLMCSFVLTVQLFFVGKEKKTANVNVLNTDVECDEETTTDHSIKFSPVASHGISDESIVDRELNNMVEQRRKSVDRFVNVFAIFPLLK